MLDRDTLMQSITLDEMKTLLIELGAQHIEDESKKGHIITNTICHNISDGKLKLYYYIEEFSFHCYTGCSCSFNIFDLVIKNQALRGIEMTFTQSIHWVANKLGRKTTGINKPDGFRYEPQHNEELEMMRKFSKKKIKIPELTIYDDIVLSMFSDYHHPSFLEDNIAHQAMDRFEIKYYPFRHKIIIPHRKWDTGEIIGIKGRSLEERDIEMGYKYVPLKINEISYAYPTYQNLYGLYQNKEAIKQSGKCIIFESEKSVLQCESYYGDNNFSVALSGSNISQMQVDMLLSLGISECIIALDKEFTDLMSDEAMRYQAKLIKLSHMLNKYFRVNVIYDTQNLLKYKDSPSDRGKTILEELLHNKQPVILKA